MHIPVPTPPPLHPHHPFSHPRSFGAKKCIVAFVELRRGICYLWHAYNIMQANNATLRRPIQFYFQINSAIMVFDLICRSNTPITYRRYALRIFNSFNTNFFALKFVDC